MAISIKTISCTSFALLAFAGNSVLCRLALGAEEIDAASFTIIRLLSGIIVLAIVLRVRGSGGRSTSRGSWMASIMLFLYAVSFSFAYNSLDTATGALILFGVVQITMILISIKSGDKLHYYEWIGVGVAFFGFVYLVTPGLATPSAFGFVLMTVAGIAWGVYTLSGRGSADPLGDTSYNFLRTLPFVVILLVVTFPGASLSQQGIVLAVLSGGIASAVGYTIWYVALGGLSSTQAAVVQLLVPLIAALGGVIFADELISYRLVFSSMLILCGILLVVLGRRYLVKPEPQS